MNLNPLLVEYCRRFGYSPSAPFEKFFTDFSLVEYSQKLPYINEVEKFCQRLAQALKQGEKICIYSDYDTDAVTATSAMYWGLLDLGFEKQNLDFYAPDRFVEGYGMNTTAVEILAKKYDLIVSVDCGINSTLEAEIIQNLKQKQENSEDICADLIITDHHHLHGELPKCVAVVNPRLSAQKQIWDFELAGKKVTTNNFLSSSVTGVGVSWFCLVWLGYYLEEMQFLADYL